MVKKEWLIEEAKMYVEAGAARVCFARDEKSDEIAIIEIGRALSNFRYARALLDQADEMSEREHL